MPRHAPSPWESLHELVRHALVLDNSTVETQQKAAGFCATMLGEGQSTCVVHLPPPPPPCLPPPTFPHLFGTKCELAMLYLGGSTTESLGASKLAQSEATFRIDAALSLVSHTRCAASGPTWHEGFIYRRPQYMLQYIQHISVHKRCVHCMA